MKKLMTIAAAALSVGLFAAPASAATISFADFAAGNEGGVDNSTFIDFGGVGIRFQAGARLSATSVDSNNFFFAYFDDVANGLPAGVGVCRVLDGAAGTSAPGAQCDDAGDDSIDGDGQIREAIQLFFDAPFDLRGISFRDGLHNPINDSLGMIEYAFIHNGGMLGTGTTTFANLVALVAAGTFAGTTAFQLGYVDTEFYIENISDVPIPGAIPLLLSGIAGLGFASRKKKTA